MYQPTNCVASTIRYIAFAIQLNSFLKVKNKSSCLFVEEERPGSKMSEKSSSSINSRAEQTDGQMDERKPGSQASSGQNSRGKWVLTSYQV